LAFSGGYRLAEGRAEFLFQCGVRWEGALWYLAPDDQHVIGLAALGFGFCEGLLQRVSECESWYFVGPPPAFGGRRPHAEAAASPQGWPPPKTSLFIQKVFDSKWYKRYFIREGGRGMG
jgi:hypothetical protein